MIVQDIINESKYKHNIFKSALYEEITLSQFNDIIIASLVRQAK